MTFVALALGAIIVVAAYGTAARLSGGWSVYRNVIAVHQRYIVNTDSFVAPTRPRLLGVVDDFFIRPYRAPVINTAVTILALVSVVAAFVRPRMAVWMAVACFAPLALLSFLMLDWLSASRFSIAYAPMMAILAADGARVAARRFQVALGGAVVVLMIAWALPAMWEAHTEPSPPARAAAWLREHYKPADCTVYVDKRVVPQSQVLLADYDRKQLDLDAAPATIVDDPKGIVFSELAISAPDAHTFVRKRPRLWDIARRRYFESCVVPSRELFTARVSGNRATVTLPPIPGDGKLLVAVRDNLAARLTFNGHDLGTMHGEATFRVLSRDRAPNELVIVAQSPVAIDRIGWVRRD
ncbi:MAG TPA: hypothetical protein VLU46_15765 [Thermoanaerobaculia bacterium]|nr:hypothetical protein [Thermoanaerobaculia bacterium]